MKTICKSNLPTEIRQARLPGDLSDIAVDLWNKGFPPDSFLPTLSYEADKAEIDAVVTPPVDKNTLARLQAIHEQARTGDGQALCDKHCTSVQHAVVSATSNLTDLWQLHRLKLIKSEGPHRTLVAKIDELESRAVASCHTFDEIMNLFGTVAMDVHLETLREKALRVMNCMADINRFLAVVGQSMDSVTAEALGRKAVRFALTERENAKKCSRSSTCTSTHP